MALGIALKLAKAGYWQGDIGNIMKAPASEVLAVAQYETFVSEYEQATFELNKESSN
jgi:hypothetical protein